jgi:hypothetical protein
MAYCRYCSENILGCLMNITAPLSPNRLCVGHRSYPSLTEHELMMSSLVPLVPNTILFNRQNGVNRWIEGQGCIVWYCGRGTSGEHVLTKHVCHVFLPMCDLRFSRLWL